MALYPINHTKNCTKDDDNVRICIAKYSDPIKTRSTFLHNGTIRFEEGLIPLTTDSLIEFQVQRKKSIFDVTLFKGSGLIKLSQHHKPYIRILTLL